MKNIVSKLFIIFILIGIMIPALSLDASAAGCEWSTIRQEVEEYYKAYISKIMGSYIYCDCLAFNWETKTDLSEMYSGWFNVDDITQIAKL